MIDRRGNQLGEVLVCLHAVTIQRRSRATRSIDHDTHGHRLGQNKAQTGFKGGLREFFCFLSSRVGRVDGEEMEDD